ncbi:hypothetical protein [Bacillus sp. FJAT-27445]|uniref:hypothetical protein n=1 Tax=Bacillus sp. FJAT-27445 TaxID=1679166 RepID=UPI0007442111|nr:hypothetical protein [Bacillus sp. FJAT-27445]
MLKKILAIIGLLFLFISNEALAPTQTSKLQPIAYAASAGKEAPKLEAVKAEEIHSPLEAIILPGIAGILIIGGLASYWLVFRKKVV